LTGVSIRRLTCPTLDTTSALCTNAQEAFRFNTFAENATLMSVNSRLLFELFMGKLYKTILIKHFLEALLFYFNYAQPTKTLISPINNFVYE